LVCRPLRCGDLGVIPALMLAVPSRVSAWSVLHSPQRKAARRRLFNSILMMDQINLNAGFRLASIGHEANACEAEDHHGPSGGFGDGTDCGACDA
jgi:hypothetical protein